MDLSSCCRRSAVYLRAGARNHLVAMTVGPGLSPHSRWPGLTIPEMQSYVGGDFDGLTVAHRWCEGPGRTNLQGFIVKIVAARTVDHRIVNSTVRTDRAVQHHVE